MARVGLTPTCLNQNESRLLQLPVLLWPALHVHEDSHCDYTRGFCWWRVPLAYVRPRLVRCPTLRRLRHGPHQWDVWEGGEILGGEMSKQIKWTKPLRDFLFEQVPKYDAMILGQWTPIRALAFAMYDRDAWIEERYQENLEKVRALSERATFL